MQSERIVLNAMLLLTLLAVNMAIYATLATAKTPAVTPNAGLYIYGTLANDERAIKAADYLTGRVVTGWGAGTFWTSVLLRALGFTIWAARFAIAGGIGIMVFFGIA